MRLDEFRETHGLHVEKEPTRRGVLKAGLLGVLLMPVTLSRRALMAAGETAEAGAGASYRAFTEPHHQRILRVITGVEFSRVLPSEEAERQAALELVLAGCDRYMAHMPPPVQDEAREALDLLDITLVRWLLGGPWGDWEQAAEEDVRAFLENLRTSRFALKRSLYQFLHDMGLIGWFGHPASWSALGYPGPPDLPRPEGEKPL